MTRNGKVDCFYTITIAYTFGQEETERDSVRQSTPVEVVYLRHRSFRMSQAVGTMGSTSASPATTETPAALTSPLISVFGGYEVSTLYSRIGG